MTLHIIPIEPIEERYSAQWLTWFDRTLSDHPVIPVELRAYEPYGFLETGETVQIHRGQFLDVVNTNAYKAKQLQILCDAINDHAIKDGDTLLFLDGWFPGLEMLAYIRDGMKLNIKIVGMFHAGTYDPNDFLTQCGMQAWGGPLENAWFAIYDQVIVATNYHKYLMTNLRRIDPSKIKVIKFPIYDYINLDIKKINQIVFPHRLSPEKKPELCAFVKTMLHDKLPSSYSLVITKDCYTNKETYYKELAKSKFAISFALQETYGLAILESVLHGCYPIVPNDLAYKELYPDDFKFEVDLNEIVTVNNMFEIIKKILQNENIYNDLRNHLRNQILNWNQSAIPNIVNSALGIYHAWA